MLLNKVHHIAIICSDIKRSKEFYIDILGFTVVREAFREERNSWKIDLALNGEYTLELFTFPDSPKRNSRPESMGLRHLAFEVDDLKKVIETLNQKNVIAESIRIDEFTGKQFTFIFDPDNLPIELYQK